MGQRLRVVGWLRFGNKAQLTKGLRAFAQHEAPGYYEADAWSVEGLDASLRLDVELPGDFTDVERPFIGMLWAAAYGYVDYFEEGNDKVRGGLQHGPLKRWTVGDLDRRLKWASPYGTSSLRYPGGDVLFTVSGRLRFDEASEAEKALGNLPLRLPYLEREGVRELRLGADVLRREGSEVLIEAAIEAPTQAAEPLLEVLRMLAAKAKTGKITMREPSWKSTVSAGAKKIERTSTREKPEAKGQPTVRPVDASAPIVRAAEASAEAPAKGAKKKAGAKEAAAEEGTLEGHPGGVSGAALLADGHLAVWGGHTVSFFGADLSLLHGFSLATDGDFAWPVNGVVALGGDRALVFHEMNGDIEIIDLARREMRRVRAHGHSVYGALVVDARTVLTFSLDGTVRISTHEGEPLHVCRVVEPHGGRVDRVIVPGDGTFVAVGAGRASRWDLRSGKEVEDLGARTEVHALSGGRYLLERYGVFELRGPGALRAFSAFTVDEGNTHSVTEVSDDELLIHSRSRRGFVLVSLRDGSQRSVATGHTKDLGAVVRLDERLWMSHARSMPGLNERFGFDGTARIWEQGSWLELGSYDARAPIREVLPLPEGRAALLLDDVVRGKEVPIYDARRTRLAATVKGSRKAVSTALALPDGRLLLGSKDGRTRVVRI
jgi:hypothetical protein